MSDTSDKNVAWHQRGGDSDRRIGAWYHPGRGTEFRVWAPARVRVDVVLEAVPSSPVALERDDDGYWSVTVPDATPGQLYRFLLDGDVMRPDPASHSQPLGVHEASCIVDHASFPWTDRGWRGMPLEAMVMYELHVGTFTPEGTFDAVIPRLQELRDIGINAIEVMPVAQFPGTRNWGYDGVYPFAVQESYGGPHGMKRLVDAAHALGMSVILDVVYNHLGPEGNYLRDFGPYFTDAYRTPWGQAVNFDGAESDHVREYFVQNARFWFLQYHFDALRVDAVHAIYDRSAAPFLLELGRSVEELTEEAGRPRFLIAESDLNDSIVVRSREQFGYGFDAQWSDDFHHALHAILTGEREGYYVDFGAPEQLRTCLRKGTVYAGEYSRFRRRRHGNAFDRLPAHQFVVFSQNHDQVGNRMHGDRLSTLIGFEPLKLVASAVLLSPYVPLLFMGEEYAEVTPFPFFVSHGDPQLVEAVRRGRREEFRTFTWAGEPPDPQGIGTFRSALLQWERRGTGRHAQMLAMYRELLRLRREIRPLAVLDKTKMTVEWERDRHLLRMERWAEDDRVVVLLNLRDEEVRLGAASGPWSVLFDSSDAQWGGGDASTRQPAVQGSELLVPGYCAILARRV